MKPVFKCDFCNTYGTEDYIREHEKDCEDNPNPTKHSCNNCKHRCINLLTLVNNFRDELDSPECCQVDGWQLAHGLPKDRTCDKWEQGKHGKIRAV